jgi:hypothetical protein
MSFHWFSFLLRSCSCLLGLYLAGVSLMLCIFCASCLPPRLLFISSSLLCTECRVAVSCFMLLSSEMESQNVPDILVIGIKRRATGYEYISMRQESAEAQLYEQMGEKGSFAEVVRRSQTKCERTQRTVEGNEGFVRRAKV